MEDRWFKDFKVWMFRNICIYLQCVGSINTGRLYFVRTPVQSLRARISLTRLPDLAVHNYGKFHYPTYGTRTVITKLWRFKLRTKSSYGCTRRQFSVIRDCPDFMGFKRFCPDVQQKSVYVARCLRVVLPNHKNQAFLTLHTNIFEFLTLRENFGRSKTVISQP
jgi:hypothetical protein